jgi:ketosteroid isomerase-like protein
MHSGKLTATSLLLSASFLAGCHEPGYTNVVHPNSQGGGYTVQRVAKTPDEPPRPVAVAKPEPRTPAQQVDETQAISSVEADFANALRSGDPLALAALLAPEYVQTGLTGNLTTRPQFLDDVKNKSLVVNAAKLADLKVTLHDDTAIATGTLALAAKLRGADIAGDYRFTDTLMRRDGRWLKIASQISKAAP